MSAKQTTLKIVYALIAVTVVIDVVLVTNKAENDTISAVLRDLSWSAAMGGFAAGHLWLAKHAAVVHGAVARWTPIVAGVMALMFALVSDSPAWSLGVGTALGSFFWPNE